MIEFFGKIDSCYVEVIIINSPKVLSNNWWRETFYHKVTKCLVFQLAVDILKFLLNI